MTNHQLYVECRSEVKGDTLTGYASTFGTYADLGQYVETFARSAFDATLANPASDVRSFYQHDSAMLLGRQSSGTLKLWTDSTGLGYELSLPKTSYAADVRELASRGDLGGMSIGFIPDSEEWGRLGNRELRTHLSVARLVEISPVSIPAYDSTTAQLRSLDHITTATTIDLRTQIALAKVRANRKATN
jgi:HK97 family phage prohead protease